MSSPLVSRIRDPQFERSRSQQLGDGFVDCFINIQVRRRVALLRGIVKAQMEDRVSIFVKQDDLAEVRRLAI